MYPSLPPQHQLSFQHKSSNISENTRGDNILLVFSSTKNQRQETQQKKSTHNRYENYNNKNMNWFGKKKTSNTPSAISATSTNRKNGVGGGSSDHGSTITSTANTVVNLRENIATQEKREAHLEKKIEDLVAEAKAKMAKKDKKGKFYILAVFICCTIIWGGGNFGEVRC
jgi:hypothetical protein